MEGNKPTPAMMDAYYHHKELVWYTNMGLYETAHYIFTRWAK